MGVTSTFYLSNDVTATIRHIDKKDIFTTTGGTVGLAIPPVADDDIRCVCWDSETLTNAVTTATITAEISAVAAGMRIRGINKFVTTGRVFLPEGISLFEVAIPDQ